jgi:colicin import membrane protein
MGRKGVSYEEVAMIADELIAMGIEPSTNEVRKRRGNTGSNSTIGRHLAKVREKGAAASAPDAQTTLPNEIAKAVTAFINAQVEAVKMAADRALAAERTAGEAAEAEVEQLTDLLDAAQARITQLEVEVSEASGRLKQGLKQANDTNLLLEAKLTAAERRVADAEKAAAVAETLVAATERRAVEAINREQEMRAELKAIPKRAN